METVTFKFSMNDTFKAVRQYIESGLGLTKQDVMDILEQYVARKVNGVDFDECYTKAISRKIEEMFRNRWGYSSASEYKDMIERAVREEIRTQVASIVKDQVEVVLKNRQEG